MSWRRWCPWKFHGTSRNDWGLLEFGWGLFHQWRCSALGNRIRGMHGLCAPSPKGHAHQLQANIPVLYRHLAMLKTRGKERTYLHESFWVISCPSLEVTPLRKTALSCKRCNCGNPSSGLWTTMIEACKMSDVPIIDVIKDIRIMSTLVPLDEFLNPVDKVVLKCSFD